MYNSRYCAMSLFVTNARGPAGRKPTAWRWVLACSWWLLLGRGLGQGLRSALGGCQARRPPARLLAHAGPKPCTPG